jgi:hypothetical protein
MFIFISLLQEEMSHLFMRFQVVSSGKYEDYSFWG